MSESCYWEARSSGDCVIIGINLAVTVLMGLFAARYFKLAPSSIRKRIRYIYLGVALWVLCNTLSIQPTSSKMYTVSLYSTPKT